DNVPEAVAHMKSAASFLRESDFVIENAIASIGWCFGGGMSLQLSLNENLAATVIYYGNLETNEERLSTITWPVLGIFADQDTVIPLDSVHQFEAALNQLGIENEIHVYEGVPHAFANPSNPGHDPEKTVDAWQKTVAFLDRNLKQAGG
ncbi:MAG: dienelactone hydrolase family protein, partial [Candidatus Binatia bacterium]